MGAVSGSVNLSASGYPAGTTVTFAPQSIAGAGVATMAVSIPANGTAGTFALAVTGTSGGRSYSATPVGVTVRPMYTGAGAIGINFVGSSTVAMLPDEVAGLIPVAHWNNASGATRSTSCYCDETGTTTTAAVTWTSNATWAIPITDQPGRPA